MTWFSSYVFGCCIAFVLFKLCLESDSFYDFLCRGIKESKEKIKNDEKYSLSEKALLDNISDESTIEFITYVNTLLSWIEILITLFFVINWLLEKIIEKFEK